MGRQTILALAVAGVSLVSGLGNIAQAGTAYTSTTDANWFNPANWQGGLGPVNTGDDDIFGGQGFTNLTPDGVVFDPTNDPNAGANPGFSSVVQLYLAGGSGSATATDVAGKLTIKSGTLTVTGGSTGFAVGRPQLNANPANTTFRATAVINGGSLITTAANGEVAVGAGQTTSSVLSFSQTNTLDYTNIGSITATAGATRGLRTNTQAIGSGQTGTANIITRHTAAGTGQLNFNSIISNNASQTTGTATTNFEFHYGGGNVDTFNVGIGAAGAAQLKLTRGILTGGGTANTNLAIVLDEAPAVVGGNVQSLGLFDVQNGATAIGLGSVTNGTAGFNGIAEGGTVSASFGGNSYSWTLYYDGNISGNLITGAGTGSDVVLVGNAFTGTPEPASLGLLGLAAVGMLRRRKA